MTHYDPSEFQKIVTQRYSTTLQKTCIFDNAILRTLNVCLSGSHVHKLVAVMGWYGRMFLCGTSYCDEDKHGVRITVINHK